MTENERLVTEQERDDCYKEWPQDENSTLFEIMSRKQDAKTLKAVGEWLIKERDKPVLSIVDKYQFEDAVLKAIPVFLSGKFPDKEK